MVIDVKSIAAARKKDIDLKGKRLLIIQVGNHEPSNRYIAGKWKDIQECHGICSLLKVTDNIVGCRMVMDYLKQNADSYDGIILQSPAFSQESNNAAVLDMIAAIQDVDGLRQDSAHSPCTPAACINLLEGLEMVGDLAGKNVAVVGKGPMVGMPLVPMLMKKGATVFALNSKTDDLSKYTKMADIVISAVGKPNLITGDMCKDGAVVLDVGIAQDENGKMCGDCDKSMYEMDNVWVTPVPGGMGLLTRVELLQNLSGVRYRESDLFWI